MSEQNDQIDVEIQRVTFRNEDNGWTVTKVVQPSTKKSFTATGSFPAITEGQSFQLFGIWTEHPHYGKQFRVNRAVPLRPSTRRAIIRYLASGIIKGIGPKTAERIVDHFGPDTLDILDESPRRLLEVPSIGRKKVEAIVAGWTEDQAANKVMMFLSNHGISPLFAHKILKLYGEEAIGVVSKDPYRLAQDIHGIGFRSADMIAKELGIAPDSAERIRAAVLFQIQTAEDHGHCYATTEQLLDQLTSLLGLDENNLYPRLIDALQETNASGHVLSENIHGTDGDRTSAHYRTRTLVAEANIAASIKRLLNHPPQVAIDRLDAWLEKFCAANDVQLSLQQMDAVKTAVTSRVFVLTGGPGVGKTTTANAIIRLFKAMGKDVALCAPTGRAAQRLTEVAAIQARTIHRLLEFNPGIGGFIHDETNPLTVQAVIVDEASMLDVHLADALFRAIPDTAQVVFIGDVDQLPSVGPGNVLRDIIKSEKVPYRQLSEIFRQAQTSQIIQIAHTINRGHVPEFQMDSDCKFVEIEDPQQIKNCLRVLVKDKIPGDSRYDPIQDIQILTPMNRGPLGTQALNAEIQDLLNPKGKHTDEVTRGQVTLRVGDKVIQTSNNYELGVFNGDIGFVQHCNVDGGKILVQFGDRLVAYKNEQALELRLAYAITIHKSQGSEFPVVLIPVSNQHFIMLQRNLIYTALTRAKKLAVFVGTRKALSHAIHNFKSSKRQTMLLARIRRCIDGH